MPWQQILSVFPDIHTQETYSKISNRNMPFVCRVNKKKRIVFIIGKPFSCILFVCEFMNGSKVRTLAGSESSMAFLSPSELNKLLQKNYV